MRLWTESVLRQDLFERGRSEPFGEFETVDLKCEVGILKQDERNISVRSRALNGRVQLLPELRDGDSFR